MEVIATDGIGNVRLEDIAARAGMSIGHVMYYFGTRERLLLQTLCWSELDVHARLTDELSRHRSPMHKAAHFVELYLPQRPRDPRWGLWFQLSAASAEPVAGVDELAAASEAWRRSFTDIVAAGVAAGAFVADPEDVTEWYLPYLDGLALEIVTSASRNDVASARARAMRRLKHAVVPTPRR